MCETIQRAGFKERWFLVTSTVPRIRLHPPLEGEGRLTLSGAKCVTTLPLQGRVKKSGSASGAAAFHSKIRAYFIGHLSWKRS